MIYRAANYLKRNHGFNTCGSNECKRLAFSGERNPFWGKQHNEQTMQRIREQARSRPSPKKGKKYGRLNLTPEQRIARSENMRQRWLENRDQMLKACEASKQALSGMTHRYRRNFSKQQRLDWTGNKCAWCGSNNHLELDHILPVSCGGKNLRENAQTLCRQCNLWKMLFIDRPLLLAGATYKGAS